MTGIFTTREHPTLSLPLNESNQFQDETVKTIELRIKTCPNQSEFDQRVRS